MPTAMVNGAEIYREELGSGTTIILSAGGLQGTLAGYDRWPESCSGGTPKWHTGQTKHRAH